MALKKTESVQGSTDNSMDITESSEKKAKQSEGRNKEIKQQEINKQKLVYVGPTIPGVIARGVVLAEGIPKKLQDVMKEHGYVKNLIVSLQDVAAANREIAGRSGAYFEFYQKACAIAKEVR